MLLTVFCLRRDRSELTFSLQVDADFELQNFRALCELESGIPAAESQIVFAEVPLTDNRRSLASYGLKDGDVVVLQQVGDAERPPAAPFPGLPRIDFSSITVPGTSAQAAQPPAQPPPAPPPRASPPEFPTAPQGLDNPALLRDMLLSNPHELSLLKERNPPLAEALLSGDLEKFSRVLVEQQQDRARREQERIRLFSADPFDLEAQAKIEEDIRQQNIEENMTIAMEEAPESFGQVVMLYINCKVNGHPVKAFVDSGAQMTIMSQACAERCNIMRLVDRRWAGIAKGVGTQKIIGRVHLAQVQIEGDFLPCSFSILEEQPMDMLLGLDMLKRHQCSIDLKKNVLVIGTTGSQTTFLPEGELPECARLAYGTGREDVRPEEMADHELAEAIQKSVEEAENSDKETTSPEISLLPTSDGFKCPVRFPEMGVKTTGTEPSCSPSSPLLKPRAAPAPSGHPEPSCAEGRGPGLAEGSRVAVLQPSSPLQQSQTGPEPPEDLGMEQTPDGPFETPRAPEDVSATGTSPFPEHGRQSKGGEQKSPCKVGESPESAPFRCPGKESLMEVEGTDQTLMAAGHQLKEQPVCASAGECPMMEAEASKPGSSLSEGLLSTGSLEQAGRITMQSPDGAATAGSPPEGQLSHLAEEACPSLASALKELHQLLVVSYHRASWKESTEQAEGLPDVGEERSAGTQHEGQERGVQPAELSPPEGLPGCVHRGAASAGEPISGAGAEDGQATLELLAKGAVISKEPWDLNNSIDPRPLAASHEPPSRECSGKLPLCLSSGQIAGNEASEQNQPPSSQPWGSESCCVLNSPPREPGMPVSSSTNEPGALHTCSPEVGPAPHQLPAFPSVDVDRLVRAGFTPQEAGEALERAGGDVDLALLLLLAKKLVVPT
ncbi:uncharacterized protein LOC143824379 isoform X2 [Paroedura picta]|uniref:uncharacterized protein LOC143824379 isoform X2 n=1 Tax=Paroedura picta TaxID=143630 RepID=UPI0040578A83